MPRLRRKARQRQPPPTNPGAAYFRRAARAAATRASRSGVGAHRSLPTRGEKEKTRRGRKLFSLRFIERPIFATVVSIIITLAGGVAVFQPTDSRSIRRSRRRASPSPAPTPAPTPRPWPRASPPPSSNRSTASKTCCTCPRSRPTTAPTASPSRSSPASTCVRPGAGAEPRQPGPARRLPTTWSNRSASPPRKRNPDILLVVSLYSPDDRFDQYLYLSNYANIHIADEMARGRRRRRSCSAKSRTTACASGWTPTRLASRGLDGRGTWSTPSREQNTPGRGRPDRPTALRQAQQEYQFTLTALGRLPDPAQFENIILRTTPDGRFPRIKDVGHVELGYKSKDVETDKLDFHDSTGVAVFQDCPTPTPSATADRIRAQDGGTEEEVPARASITPRPTTPRRSSPSRSSRCSRRSWRRSSSWPSSC